MKKGIVKWFRHDGVGYLISQDGRTILFDRSVLTGKDPVHKANVYYSSKMILGREVATRVRGVK